MKIGMNIRLNVSLLDKARFFKGKKGTYADLSCFVDTENTDQYGNNGTATQAITADERKEGLKLPILGNARIFYTDGGSRPGRQPERKYGPSQPDDACPF